MAGTTPWGAIATGVTGIAGLFGQKKRQKRQHNYNMALADHQFDRQYQMWDEQWQRETEYNDPSAQMARYKNAGINPHMAYMTGGGQNTASTGELPKYSVDGQQVAPNIMEQSGNILSKYFQNATMETELRKNKASADQEEIQAELMRQGLDLQKKNKKLQHEEEYLKASQKIPMLYGDRGNKLTRYEQSLEDDSETKTIQKLVAKSQKYLNEITASNLITNDQLIEMQTKIQKSQFDFINSDWFKELPAIMQGTFMALGKKLGGI